MTYTYYPGCSLHATSRAYDESIRAIAGTLGLELAEVEDWNCCGATAYMSVNETLSHCLTARNLALAAAQGGDMVAPCSACYTNLMKTNSYLKEFPDLKEKVDSALAEADLTYGGDVKVRHFLEVVVNDIGLEKIRGLVKKPLDGLKIAPYYGCQIVRPLSVEDDPDEPVLLDHLLEALGATVVTYPMKTTCCGGSLMGTKEEVARRLTRNLLLCAAQFEADVIAVTCPLCQMNLDGYQTRINKEYGTAFEIPVLYFPQLMGMAFGEQAEPLGLQRGVVPLGETVSRYVEGSR